MVLWAKYMSSQGHPHRTYRNMTILGRITGARAERYQTPYEYQQDLEKSINTSNPYISIITKAYVQAMYSQHELDISQTDEIIQAWRKLRFLLIFNILRPNKGTGHE